MQPQLQQQQERRSNNCQSKRNNITDTIKGVITTGANKIADADVIMVVAETAAVADATTAFALTIKAEATTGEINATTVADTAK